MLYESFNLKLYRLNLGCMTPSSKLGEKQKIYICENVCKLKIITSDNFYLNSIQSILFFNTID